MSGRLSAVKRIRKNFGKIRKIVEIPDLIGMQRESFTRFLQMGVAPEDRRDVGLQAVFKSVFPIKDFTGSASLEFVSYRFAEIKHSEEECVQRGMTYELPVRITVRLVVYEIDKDTGVSNIRDIKEQEIYFGTIPLMTAKGTFIINGTERVVVSQLHRSSGVFFDHDKGKTHSSGKIVYSSRIIPVRGSWIDMEIDPKDIIHIRIDRRRKFPITILFKSFGYSTEDILAYFYRMDKIIIKGKQIFKAFDPELLKGQRATKDIEDPDTGEVVVKKGRIYTKRSLKQLSDSSISMIPVSTEEIEGRISAQTLVDPKSGEVMVAANGVIDTEIFETITAAGIETFDVLHIDGVISSDSIHKTMLLDKVDKKDDALVEIYRRLRPGNPATPEVAQDFVDHLFFKSSYYDLSSVGRLKLNLRLGIDTPCSTENPEKGGHPPHRQNPGEAPGHPGGRGRHRPSRQPPGSGCWRTPGKPVPHRPGQDGARHQGAHEPAGSRRPDAPRPGQPQTGFRRGQRIFRHQPAQPVHGSDQPACRKRPTSEA
jgi:DNA-directed RNA polymerase subunit beta